MRYNNNFDFILPTCIKFGCGRVSDVGQEVVALNGKRAMIVTDKGIVEAGLLINIIAALNHQKIDIIVFDEVEPNPRDTTVERGAKIAKEAGIDVLVAVGGGSSMDVAKGIGVLLTHGGKIRDYEGDGTIYKPITPVIAIPTTVGTGSEVTFWAVITDTKEKFKFSIGSYLAAPRVALVDPDMVSTLPANIIASTGMDALTHAIEGYTCLLSEPVTDALALYAIEMITKNIRDAVYSDCEESQSSMILASTIAGIAFGNSDVGGVHSMAEAVGAMYDTPHGIANAILLPYVMEYNCEQDIDKHARIASAMGVDIKGLSKKEAAHQSIEAVKQLSKDLKIPALKEVGVLEKDLEKLAAKAALNSSSGSNLKPVSSEDYFELFKKAFFDFKL